MPSIIGSAAVASLALGIGDRVSAALARDRLVARSSLCAGVMALVLAVIGLHGVTAYRGRRSEQGPALLHRGAGIHEEARHGTQHKERRTKNPYDFGAT